MCVIVLGRVDGGIGEGSLAGWDDGQGSGGRGMGERWDEMVLQYTMRIYHGNMDRVVEDGFVLYLYSIDRGVLWVYIWYIFFININA